MTQLVHGGDEKKRTTERHKVSQSTRVLPDWNRPRIGAGWVAAIRRDVVVAVT